MDEPDSADSTPGGEGGPADTAGGPLSPYEALIDDLKRIRSDPDAVDDDLQSGVNVLISVHRFLAADARMLMEELDRPLAMLLNALIDTLKGGKPPLIFSRPTQATGRPSDKTQSFAQGALAAAMSILMLTGTSRNDAARTIAKEARKNKIFINGKQITANQIARWRGDINSKAPVSMNGTYSSIMKGFSKPPGQSIRLHPSLAEGQNVVAGIIKSLKAGGF